MDRRALAATLAALSATAASCVASDLADAPPPEVTLVGAVAADGAAVHPSTPGLRRVAPGDALPLTITPDAPWIAVGYRDADLAPLGAVEDRVLEATPLEVIDATGCWPLPAPAWTAPLTAAAAGRPPPRLSAAWARQCPDPGTNPRFFDVRCLDNAAQECGLASTTDGLCTLALPSAACPSIAARFSIESDGGACLAAADRSTSCAPAPAPPGASSRARCGRCTIDTYPATPPAPLAVDVIPLDVTPIATPVHFEFEVGRLRDLTTGPVRALGVRDRAVLVVTDEASQRDDGRCLLQRPSGDRANHDLHLIDADTTRERTRTSTGVCVSQLARDPHGPGFVAAYYRGKTLGLARVDLDGRWSDAHTAPRQTNADVDDAVVSARAMMANTGDVIVVAEHTEHNTVLNDPSWVYAFDARTLAPLGAGGQPYKDEVSGVVALSADEVLITVVRANASAVVRARDPAPPVILGSFRGGARVALPVIDAAGRIYATDLGLAKALLHLGRPLEPPVVIGLAHAFEEPAMLLESLPLDDTRLIASAITSRDGRVTWDASLLLIAREEDELRVLPGALPVPGVHGPIFALQRDAAGRVWGMAPWAGAIVRIVLPP